MHETSADIAALQQLLDRSYDAAGPHLRAITTPERRVGAEELVRRLTPGSTPRRCSRSSSTSEASHV
jgi:hypothetical protein